MIVLNQMFQDICSNKEKKISSNPDHYLPRNGFFQSFQNCYYAIIQNTSAWTHLPIKHNFYLRPHWEYQLSKAFMPVNDGDCLPHLVIIHIQSQHNPFKASKVWDHSTNPTITAGEVIQSLNKIWRVARLTLQQPLQSICLFWYFFVPLNV